MEEFGISEAMQPSLLTSDVQERPTTPEQAFEKEYEAYINKCQTHLGDPDYWSKFLLPNAKPLILFDVTLSTGTCKKLCKVQELMEKVDVLRWFHEHSEEFPIICGLLGPARHTICTSSGFQERVFSTARFKQTALQGNLSADQLGSRTLLAHNRTWFEAARERSDATMSSASRTHLEAVLKDLDIDENDDVSEEDMLNISKKVGDRMLAEC